MESANGALTSPALSIEASVFGGFVVAGLVVILIAQVEDIVREVSNANPSWLVFALAGYVEFVRAVCMWFVRGPHMDCYSYRAS